jgi:uncharacterized MAPEG superfamily protein
MDSAGHLYALVSAILVLQLILLAFWVGAMRTIRKQYTNPEDKVVIKGALVDDDHADVLRAKRAHLNALENAVPFFAVGALYAASGPSLMGAQVYFFTFLGARVLHSIFYLWGRQPFRTLCFAIGALATIGMAVHVIRTSI